MERPTQEQVDQALRYAADDERDGTFSITHSESMWLAREVRALREERDSWQQAHVELTKLLGDTQGLLRDVERDRDWAAACSKALQESQERLAIELRECQRHRDIAREASEAAELRIVELRAELAQERESTAVMWGCDVSALKKATDVVLKAWSDFTSQEMYGEMLRDGMDAVDFDNWEEAHDELRKARGES